MAEQPPAEIHLPTSRLPEHSPGNVGWRLKRLRSGDDRQTRHGAGLHLAIAKPAHRQVCMPPPATRGRCQEDFMQRMFLRVATLAAVLLAQPLSASQAADGCGGYRPLDWSWSDT